MTQFSKEELDAENLRKAYENLLIENNELDLELIDANMKIREKNNEMIKLKILKQKNINDFNQTRNNLINDKAKNREQLNILLEELKTKESYVTVINIYRINKNFNSFIGNNECIK